MYNMDINSIVKQMQEFKLFGLKFRLEVVLLCVALGYVIGAHVFCSCLTVDPQEGFALLTDMKNLIMNRLTGKTSGSGSGSGSRESFVTSQFAEVDSGIDSGVPNPEGVAAHLKNDHTSTSMPLDNDKKDFFEKTEFKADCCPSTFSNGDGCACLSFDQLNHIRSRGGNSTQTSEF